MPKELVYSISPELPDLLGMKDVPAWPGFKWAVDCTFGLKTVLAQQPEVLTTTFEADLGIKVQLAAYALPWTVEAGKKVSYCCYNPKWGLYDYAGGRINPFFEWPGEGFETMRREVNEETGADIPTVTTDRYPLFWLYNPNGRTLGSVFRPFLVGEPKDLVPIPAELGETTATRRLLATLSIFKSNPDLSKVPKPEGFRKWLMTLMREAA